MATEIEHKYLVVNDSFKTLATASVEITQGYIDRTPEHVVRVRRKACQGFITIKGLTHGDTRAEYEYEVPSADVDGLLALCQGRILHKRRWIVPYEGHIWEVDEYGGDLKGLIVAEIELPSSDVQYSLPPFVGKDVTCDPAYFNSNL